MTPNQIAALDYVRDCIARGGFSPTLAAIGARVGVSKHAARRLVISLVETGHLSRRPGRKCAIELAQATDLRGIETEALHAELARRGVVPGALAGPQRRVFNRRGVSCAADGCNVEVQMGHAFCLDHWRAIDADVQRGLLQANRIARQTRCDDDVARYQEMFGRARDQACRRVRHGEAH